MCEANYLFHSKGKKVKICFYLAQYPIREAAQSALPLADLFNPTPNRLLWEAF